MSSYCLGLYEKAMPAGLPFERMLEAAARCGFDALEISIDETPARLSRLSWPREKRLALRAAADRAGIPLKTMCLSGHRRYPLGARDPAVREQAMEILRRAIEFSADTGVRLIQLAGYDVYYEPGDGETEKYFAENLRLCAQLAATAGVLLGFETMETPFMDTVQKAMRWVRAVDCAYLGVYPDIGNLKNASISYGTDLCRDLAAGKGHLFAAHLKETTPGAYRDLAFGQGHTEYVPCVALLYEMGVRHFTGEFWYDGAPDYEKTLRGAARFLRGKIEEAIFPAQAKAQPREPGASCQREEASTPPCGAPV